MKMNLLAIITTTAFLTPAWAEEVRNPPPTPAPQPPPPMYQAPAAPPPEQVYVYDQKPLPGMPALVTAEQAQSIVDQFKTNFVKTGNPRILVYVNRDLIDDHRLAKSESP